MTKPPSDAAMRAAAKIVDHLESYGGIVAPKSIVKEYAAIIDAEHLPVSEQGRVSELVQRFLTETYSNTAHPVRQNVLEEFAEWADRATTPPPASEGDERCVKCGGIVENAICENCGCLLGPLCKQHASMHPAPSVPAATTDTTVLVSREWQPIETAPKDSSWILAVVRTGRQTVVRWGGGAWEDDNRLCRDPVEWMPLPPYTKEHVDG